MRVIPDPSGIERQWLILYQKDVTRLVDGEEVIVKVSASRLVCGADTEEQALTLFKESNSNSDTPPPVTEGDIRREAQVKLESLVKPYEPGERETWSTQVEEARAIIQNVLNPAPLLRERVKGRLDTVTELAQKILQKDRAFRAAVGRILADQDRAIRELMEGNEQ